MSPSALEYDRPSRELAIRLDADDRAPGHARRFVRHNLEELGYPKTVDDAVVVVSELVTNAAAAAPYTPIFVALLPSSGRVLLEVWDMSPDRPVMRSPDTMATAGRGLHVVEELSVTYGCNQCRSGAWKVVWALLDGENNAQYAPAH
jgi:serine/threonine-protein kinase RsbW